MALCARPRSPAFLWAASASKCRSIWVRWRRGELPAGVWNPFVFEDMKRPRELSKEFLDFLVDGTCRTPINFGIHVGTPLGALPTDYLVWLSNDFRSDTVDWRWWRDVARQALKERASVHIGKRQEFIAALARAGNVDYTLELLRSEANQVDSPPGYAALLRHCAQHRALEQGIKVHNQLVAEGFARNPFLAELLIEMYSQCGAVDLALQVFESLERKKRGVSAWAAMIRCYVENGDHKRALEAYKNMDLEADSELLVVMFDCCARARALAEGRVIHACLVSSEVRADLKLRTAIFAFYAQCGDLEMARKLFVNLEKKSAEAWNVMIKSYVDAGRRDMAMGVYEKMERSRRSRETILIALDACCSLEEIGRVEEDASASKVIKKSDHAGVKAAIAAARKRLQQSSRDDQAGSPPCNVC
ncbi:pentatricopeptide repeat-containing protein At5g27110 [Selaginella moellendorffii]|uniref:pentatricopeptide repeat-containing protein At5g27110 n=1 Tax=Selaginella moellendorffii TaxID=88036 RepID=UPI000D1CE20F|nr:pentatricopeptide repeat-containing protein At5g27110 [Selaginella moellendorffii]|eukprot:XP_024528519.1 pentatricopeptide repeat-containing protein At5g27110 [Selaginella moellendorffii]